MFPPTPDASLCKWAGVIQHNAVKVLFSTDEFKDNKMTSLIQFCFQTKDDASIPSTFTFRYMAFHNTFYNVFCFMDANCYNLKGFDVNLPSCICIVTEYYDLILYEGILKTTRSLLLQSSSIASKFFKRLYANALSIELVNARLAKITRMSRESYIMHTIKCITDTFNSETVAELIFALICEIPMIVVSNDLRKVSKFCYALYSLIHPFKWHHLFVPILPKSLIDSVDSPSPYIIGLHSSLVDSLKDHYIEAHILINADQGIVEYYNSEPSLPWMKQICSAMKKVDYEEIQKTIIRFICYALGTYPSSSPLTTAKRLITAKNTVKYNITSVISKIVNSRACNDLVEKLNERPIPNAVLALLSSCNDGTISPASQKVEEFPLMKSRVYRSSSAKILSNSQKKDNPNGIRQSQSMSLNQ